MQSAALLLFIRSIVDAKEADDKAIRIIGNKDVLRAVIAGKQNTNRMFVVLYAPQIRSPGWTIEII